MHGGVGKGVIFDDTWRLRLGAVPTAGCRWERVPPPAPGCPTPGALYGHTMVNHPWDDGSLYLFGGRRYAGVGARAPLWQLSAGSNAWTVCACDGPAPEPQFSHCFVSLSPSPAQRCLSAARAALRRLAPGTAHTAGTPVPGMRDWSTELGLHALDPTSPTTVEEAGEDQGYWSVLPPGYAGPFSAAPKSRAVLRGQKVYDPTPCDQLELRAHAAYRRIVLLGGVRIVGGGASAGAGAGAHTPAGTAAGFIDLAHVRQLCVSPPMGAAEAVPLLKQLADTRDAEAFDGLPQSTSLTASHARASAARAAMWPDVPVASAADVSGGRGSAATGSMLSPSTSYEQFKRIANGHGGPSVLGVATMSSAAVGGQVDEPYYARLIERQVRHSPRVLIVCLRVCCAL